MYTVYMLMFEDGFLYTGMTRNSHRRRKQHFQKRGKPTVIYRRSYPTQAEAVAREAQIKGWSRSKKMALAEDRETDLFQLARRRSGIDVALPGQRPFQQRYESLARGGCRG